MIENKHNIILQGELLKKIERAANLKNMDLSEFINWALTDGITRTEKIKDHKPGPVIFP